MSCLPVWPDALVHHRYPLLLAPFSLGSLRLPNRMVVAPMTRVSATTEGVPTEAMARYYSRFAEGGFGLIITEGTYPEAEHGSGLLCQPGLVTEPQADGWARVCSAVHEADGIVFAQLMHAGALAQSHARTIAPSAVQPWGEMMPEYGGTGPYPVPREMTARDIARAVESFADSARRAERCGFDGVEIHGANGYLIDQFLTAYTNQRTDEYGGPVENRIRFAADVIRAVRSAVSRSFVVGIRLSETKVNDFSYRWPGGLADGQVIFRAIRDAGAQYIHLANEGRSFQASRAVAEFACLAREVSGVPVIANGGLHEPALAESVLDAGWADLISLGRAALVNPDWPCRVETGRALRSFDRRMIEPSATLENAELWWNRYGD
jgi:2,4-dienoyl-CoA reductase-like NADH-dependent reductase (Old Yellow Enzyme family)